MRGVDERRWRSGVIGALGVSVMVFGAIGIATAQPTVPVCGDADQTGSPTVTDGVQILRAAAGLSGPCGDYADRCDLDSDGRVTVSDGVLALDVAAAVATKLYCDRGTPRPCDLPLATVPVLGRRADFPPSAPNICGLGGSLASNYQMPRAALDPAAAEELHVIAVAEGEAPAGHATGTVEIHVRQGAKPVSLFLSAPDAVRWDLKVDRDATMGRVIVQGSGEQQVDGVPAGVPVVSWSPAGGYGYMYGWEVEANRGGGNYSSLMTELRAFAGTTETSFQGCYHGAGFEVPFADGEPRPCRGDLVDGDESLAQTAVEFDGCEAVTTEDHYCLTVSQDFASSTQSLAVVGLESGRVCPVVSIAPGLGLYEATSLAWRGEVAYVCAAQGLVRISLRDGGWEAAQLPCDAVTGTDDTLFVLRSYPDSVDDAGFPRPGRVDTYESFAAILGGQPNGAYEMPWSTRLTATDDRLFGAWHATDHVDALDRSSGQPLAPIPLEDYDDRINGLAVTDSMIAVSLGFSGDGGQLVIFDARTGKRLRDLPTDQPLTGLACVTR